MNAKLTKTDLVASVAKEVGLSKAEAECFVNAFFEVIVRNVAAGVDIVVPGMLSVKVVHRNERKGRNPKTGKEIKIPAGNSVKIKAGSALKNAATKNKKKK